MGPTLGWHLTDFEKHFLLCFTPRCLGGPLEILDFAGGGVEELGFGRLPKKNKHKELQAGKNWRVSILYCSTKWSYPFIRWASPAVYWGLVIKLPVSASGFARAPAEGDLDTNPNEK